MTMILDQPRRASGVRFLGCSLLLCTLITCSGCATLLSEKRYAVTIDNPAAPTFFSVHDRKNRVIQQGITPQQVTLDAKAFPFWPAKYSVVYSGREAATEKHEIKAGVDPWISGNILLGGVAGLVVDGATGSMFKLPKTVKGNVPPQYAVTDLSAGASIAHAAIEPPSDDAGETASPMLASGSEVIPASPTYSLNDTPVRTASASGNDTPPTLSR
ncbi:hypothetical protein NZK35_00965 [Stieleria sp. ICT_E10.1]|uniref:hypothetical protein n=1 Tax=Stieleria sedimenti TaxID=2976331 RepID=UPI00217FD1EC|nr:hypothetical protein [Stieleria sedimenti]MCS7465239.1 hypothetical protein [Stieleria sedimenti]